MTPGIISGSAIDCVLPWEAIVGESPVWHATEQRLYWIDIQGKQIHRFDPASKANESFSLPEIVTCIAIRAKGGLILTLKKSFAFFDPATNQLEKISNVEEDLPSNRFNDGKCDPQGRFWAGTMDATEWQKPSGNLFRMDADRNVTLMQSHVICSNGSGWSPDGRTMYYTESFRYAIFAYDFDPASGAISNRRTFAEIDRNSGGFPDGMTVDAEGFVWSNQVGLGRIVRYDPQGNMERIVQLPVPRATDCTFGGSNLDILYITSARETMTPKQLEQAPLSGSLFAVNPGVRGLLSTPFAG
ncbi:MAG TPA: SMP-30/gluconolactonase/LRE family protein [Acidobacteriaceae bacterium]|jgi:sugar lactone lactonase YvrE|nr:SMP-30/gluconolactonase/LRE family protein [Acidobacteriaceae bacterium]